VDVDVDHPGRDVPLIVHVHGYVHVHGPNAICRRFLIDVHERTSVSNVIGFPASAFTSIRRQILRTPPFLEVGVSRIANWCAVHGTLKLPVSSDERTRRGVHIFGTGAERVHIRHAVMGCAGSVDCLVDTDAPTKSARSTSRTSCQVCEATIAACDPNVVLGRCC
jgi:hypothetical protein